MKYRDKVVERTRKKLRGRLVKEQTKARKVRNQLELPDDELVAVFNILYKLFSCLRKELEK